MPDSVHAKMQQKSLRLSLPRSDVLHDSTATPVDRRRDHLTTIYDTWDEGRGAPRYPSRLTLALVHRGPDDVAAAYSPQDKRRDALRYLLCPGLFTPEACPCFATSPSLVVAPHLSERGAPAPKPRDAPPFDTPDLWRRTAPWLASDGSFLYHEPGVGPFASELHLDGPSHASAQPRETSPSQRALSTKTPPRRNLSRRAHPNTEGATLLWHTHTWRVRPSRRRGTSAHAAPNMTNTAQPASLSAPRNRCASHTSWWRTQMRPGSARPNTRSWNLIPTLIRPAATPATEDASQTDFALHARSPLTTASAADATLRLLLMATTRQNLLVPGLARRTRHSRSGCCQKSTTAPRHWPFFWLK